MIYNLQEEIDIDLDEVFERSRYDWLGFQDIHDILHKRQELAISTEPVQFPEEGIYLYNTSVYKQDNTEWRSLTKTKVLRGDIKVRYKIDQCPLVPIEEGFTSTYERRAYRCQELYGRASTLVHYRSYHLSDNDSGDEVDTGEDTEDSQNPSDDDDEDSESDTSDEDGDNTGEDTEDSQNPSDDDESDTSDEDDDSDTSDDDSDSGGDDNNQLVDVVPPLANGVGSAAIHGNIPEISD